MMFVDDTKEACEWYSRLLFTPPKFLEEDYPVIPVDDAFICFHKADEKVSSGRAGTVTYWSVKNFPKAVAWANENGGKVYRGPLNVEDGFSICQILDPFGNLFGLHGRIDG